MQGNVTVLKIALLGAAVVVGGATATDALAKSHSAPAHASRGAAVVRTGASAGSMHAESKRERIGGHGRKVAWGSYRGGRYASSGYGGGIAMADATTAEPSYSYGGMSCVPFARANSGIELAGNAWSWWSNAAGVYERGSRPEVGSVLNFRANGHMHSGHVAVVTNVDNPRTVEIDHANWSGRGAISRNVTVVDVSPANDWSAVRVALGRSGGFGSVYPTYGFIYDRPDHGTMVANNTVTPIPAFANAAPRDLRPTYEQVDSTSLDAASGDEPVEVAEATTRGSYRHSYAHSSARHGTGRFAMHGTVGGGLIHRVKATLSPVAGPAYGKASATPHQATHKRVRG